MCFMLIERMEKGKRMADCEKQQTLIERVRQMELYYDMVWHVLETEPELLYQDADVQKMIKELNEYTESGLWLEDFECDERGELPKDLRRGVLSQDGLYDLLTEIKILSLKY